MTRRNDHGEPSLPKLKSAWVGFKDFIGRDNVLEVALGLLISQSFMRVVNSLVSDVILPPISLLPFLGKNLPSKFAVLRKGPNAPYNTLKQASDDGAVTLAYGSFIDSLFNFIFLGIILYLLANLWGTLTHTSIIKHTVKCAYCRKDVSEKAQRCPFCTSWQDGREDQETSALPPATQ